MQNKLVYTIIGLAAFVFIIGGVLNWYKSQRTSNQSNTSETVTTEYNPTINPDDFVPHIDNKYFTLKPGTKFRYENKMDEEREQIEVEVTNETRQVMGVTATIVRDRVWLNNELVEDTRDWYAQDKEGNVWYFGEDVDNYENGKLKDHKGAWEAGIDGAKPGIIMPANPKPSYSYRQEYYQGKAEDMGDIVATDKKVTVAYGTFENCLQTRDWNKIDENANEYKYYCPDVGFAVLEESVSGGTEKVELISVTVQ